jgi:kynurenine formamidase
MGKNGPPQMNLPGNTGKPITEEYIDQFGIEAYAAFERAVYIEVHGQEAYDAKFGDLEALGNEGTWEPCHKQMLGHGIVGVENLGGDLDKVAGKRFRFYCFPIRWYMGDGSMVRCVAEIDEEDVNKDVADRTYTYCGTGYGPASGY